MEKTKPLKRDPNLQPISREHHHTLLLCWKIRKGFSKNIEVERIKRYADWFFEEHIRPHFEVEEKYIFPVLGKEHELVKKALSEHRRLRRLFDEAENIEVSLSLIEEELDAHIRFEERILFPEVQEIASQEQLKDIKENHDELKFKDNTEDEFWL